LADRDTPGQAGVGPAPDDGTAAARFRVAFGLRLKITVTFLLIGLAVSAILASSILLLLERSLFREMQSRVSGLARIGVELVDTDALLRLLARITPEVSAEEAAAVEDSADFRAISDALNAVRATEERLVHYIYLFAPTPDPDTALFVVDADVIADRDRQESGGEPSEDVSHFGSVFDVSAYPVARRVLAEKVPLVEQTYTRDEDFGVNSLTGYAPILAADGTTLLGALGIDMLDGDVRAALRRARTISGLVIAGAVLLTVLASVFMGALFTRGIESLDHVVRTFGKENLAVRAAIRSRDEVGRLGASFNAMAETIQGYSTELEALLGAYGRFVPHQFLRVLAKESVLDVKLGDNVEREMTVLFSDIRSFTTLSESMTPLQNFRFLNSYLERVGPVIRDAGGFIDKYIGDAIMALFPGTADDGLAAAVAMQKAVVQYNVHRRSSGYLPISIGVGVHTGSLMLGTLGDEERMDGSVIADAVNVCARLEGLTRVYGAGILTTGRTIKSLSAPARFATRFVDRVQVKGRAGTVLLFEVLDGDPPAARELKLSYRDELARALRLYYARSFAEALRILSELRARNPQDEVVRIFRNRCELYGNLGAPEGWKGIELIEVK
jgi:class 3 adenylate cyclase/HAMP domain-containing protein